MQLVVQFVIHLLLVFVHHVLVTPLAVVYWNDFMVDWSAVAVAAITVRR